MLSRSRGKKTKKLVAGGLLIALFFLIFFSDSFAHYLSGPALYVAKPFLRAGAFATEWYNAKMSVFKNKENLEKENMELRNRVSFLESKLILCEAIERESEEIKNSLGRVESGNLKMAYIINKPPKSPYDILLLDAGSKGGINKGMEVTAYGNILLGYVSEVFPSVSKVKLISFPDEEISGFLQGLNVSVIALGKGGGNLEISLPKAIEAEAGEKIIRPGEKPLLMGIVERVDSEPSDPFQKIYFRLPVNIMELKHVFIKI